MLSHEVEDYWNHVLALIGQHLVSSGILSSDPTGNTGASYENDTFYISAYDWTEEDGSQVPPNFWFKESNYQIEWYKYLGRGNLSNRESSFEEAMHVLGACIISINNDYSSPRVDPPEFVWEDLEPEDDE